MGKYLSIERVTQQGGEEVACLKQGELTVGREPGEPGVQLDSTAISRQHGVFMRCGGIWLYKDLGSTNGSWINGSRLAPHSLRVIRSGDLVQLADAALRVEEKSDGLPDRPGLIGAESIGGRSLLVFRKGEFLREYPIPEYGRALTIGGSNPDLELSGDLFEQPSLVVERRGENICAYSVAHEMSVYVNREEITETSVVKDNDEVGISDYVMLLNDPGQVQGLASASPGRPTGSTTNLRGWFDNQPAPRGGRAAAAVDAVRDAKAVRRTVFGQQVPADEDESDETEPIDTRQVSRGGISHPSMRSVGLYQQKSRKRAYTLGSLEDKILLGVGLLLLMAMVVVVALMAWG